MSEDQALQTRIRQLSGHINFHKSQKPTEQLKPGDERQNRAIPSYEPYRSSLPGNRARGSLYNRPRARAGKIIHPSHRNRTLVLKNEFSQNHPPEPVESTSSDGEVGVTSVNASTGHGPLPCPNGWISKRDRHMQLISSSIFEKEVEARNKAIDTTRRQKAQEQDVKEKLQVNRHIQTITRGQEQSAFSHKIAINGLQFLVCDGGSKLSRLSGSFENTHSTPKRATVGGVTFYRSKNGNLYRAGLVKAKRALGITRKTSEPCKLFTRTGRCSKGPLCPNTHDPAKVAICQDYFQTGDCPLGEGCDLSHDPTAERVPACMHFQRGKCSNPTCRYAHVRVNPSAYICKDFAALGYCTKGSMCDERHVHECPTYGNTGTCRNKKCQLPHVDRAGQIRKHTTNFQSSGQDEDSDLSSNEEDFDAIDSDDVDSDGLENDLDRIQGHSRNHALSQQEDFVHF